MPRGTLEVILVGAKGLDNNDFLTNIDPYVILKYRTQEHKSTVAKGSGSNPLWNESFLFTISDHVSKLHLKLMDVDTFTEDDYLGEAKIHLDPVFDTGSIPETAYNVVNNNKEYCGEIKVALIFTPEEGGDEFFSKEDQSYGGWNESIREY